MRYFDGSDSDVVKLADNEIILNDHYFVTGEKVEYVYDNSGSSTSKFPVSQPRLKQQVSTLTSYLQNSLLLRMERTRYRSYIQGTSR